MPEASPPRRQARTPRFYHSGPIQPETDLTLDKSATHHLITVLRTRANDNVTLFNGDGLDYQATVSATGQRGDGKFAVLTIHKSVQGVPESSLPVTLVQCVSRPERMDICLRQSVELGVSCIQPLYSRHSLKPGDATRAQKKQLHWQSIIISACEQSGRSTLPELMPAMAYPAWLQSKSPDSTRYILSPSATQSLTEHAVQLSKQGALKAVALIIGPESGLDEDEIDSTILTGAIPVHLGKRILRTETAGPACIAVLQSTLGDMRS